jgi:hypothetical protein
VFSFPGRHLPERATHLAVRFFGLPQSWSGFSVSRLPISVSGLPISVSHSLFRFRAVQLLLFSHSCVGRTSIERSNLCQAFGPDSSGAGRITVAISPLGRSRDSEIRVLSRFRLLICRCGFPLSHRSVLLSAVLIDFLAPSRLDPVSYFVFPALDLWVAKSRFFSSASTQRQIPFLCCCFLSQQGILGDDRLLNLERFLQLISLAAVAVRWGSHVPRRFLPWFGFLVPLVLEALS